MSYIFSEASRYLVDVLSPVNEVQREEWIDKMIEIIQKQPRKAFVYLNSSLTLALPNLISIYQSTLKGP